MTLHREHDLSFFGLSSFSQLGLPHQYFTAIAFFLSLSVVSLSVAASGCGGWYSCGAEAFSARGGGAAAAARAAAALGA